MHSDQNIYEIHKVRTNVKGPMNTYQKNIFWSYRQPKELLHHQKWRTISTNHDVRRSKWRSNWTNCNLL